MRPLGKLHGLHPWFVEQHFPFEHVHGRSVEAWPQIDELALPFDLALDHRGVVGIDQVGLGVQRLHRGVVGLGVVDVVVDADEGEEGVDGHGGLL